MRSNEREGQRAKRQGAASRLPALVHSPTLRRVAAVRKVDLEHQAAARLFIRLAAARKHLTERRRPQAGPQRSSAQLRITLSWRGTEPGSR